MTTLEAAIDYLRTRLAAEPAAVTFASLPPGRVINDNHAALPADLRALLTATDGPRCGSVVLFSLDELDDNQYYCEDLDGGIETWLCFGLDEDCPLFLHRESGEVWWYPSGIEGMMSGELVRLTNDLETFITGYVLGDGYASIVTDGEHDRWYTFARAHQQES